jgi:hypothetical protein
MNLVWFVRQPVGSVSGLLPGAHRVSDGNDGGDLRRPGANRPTTTGRIA